MDRISLNGIEVFAHHGVLDHERRLGQRFVVDVDLELDLRPAATSDDLADTVDYGALAGRIGEAVGGPPAALLETVAARVADLCLDDDRVSAVEVRVHKPSAPLPVPGGGVTVTLRRERP